MRILTVTNMYPTPARQSYGAFVQSQVASLQEAGHDVDVLFIDGRTSKGAYLLAPMRIRARTRVFRPDLLHAHYGLTGFLAAAAFTSQPLVLSLCGDDVLGTPSASGGLTPISQLGRLLTRIACRAADQIIVKTAGMAAVIQSWGITGAAVVPNGVDTQFFRPPTATDRSEARQRLGFTDAKRHLLWPHTPYEYRKRCDLAQRAVATLGPNHSLHIVYHRPRTILRDYYYASDLMLLTSEWEGSPNTVKEAMACNLPTVSFDVGDVATLVEGTKSHRVVPRHALAAMIQDIKELLESGVRDGADRIASALSAAAVAARITRIYEAALNRDAGKQCST